LEESPLMHDEIHNGRSLAAILGEMKSELQEFVHTRIELFKRELQEKAASIKRAVPAALIGATFGITAVLLLSLALVALVAVGFGDNPYKWFFAFLIVGVLWSVMAGMALFMAKRRLTMEPMVPKKTMHVLKDDKIWLQKETRNAL
jgi:uncharacterized membrane protein YqjE